MQCLLELLLASSVPSIQKTDRNVMTVNFISRNYQLNVWIVVAVGVIIFSNFCLIYILGSKLLQVLHNQEVGQKVIMTTETAAPDRHAQLTSETIKYSSGHTSIKVFPKKPKVTAVLSKELVPEHTASTTDLVRAPTPESYKSGHRRHKEHGKIHKHLHQQEKKQLLRSHVQPNPAESHKHILARHDQHSLTAESNKPDTSQSSFILPNIKVTSIELKKLYATEEKVIAKEAVKLKPKEDRNLHEVTLVTALLDIGRETWQYYGRPFAKYHSFMQNILQIRMPLVVFVDQRSVEFVQTERHKIGWLEFTKIWVVSIEDLPLYLYHRTMKSIMEYEINGTGWRPEWDSSMKSHPETCNFKYDVLVNSKPYFLYNASNDNPFNTKFFTWLDAGYGHGKMEFFPFSYEWRPMFKEGKVSIIKLTPLSDKLTRYQLKDLYRQDVAVVSGGFLAGDRATLAKFYQHYHWKVVLLLTEERVVDDDQTVLVLLIKDIPDLFNVVLGDWFDAFMLF